MKPLAIKILTGLAVFCVELVVPGEFARTELFQTKLFGLFSKCFRIVSFLLPGAFSPLSAPQPNPLSTSPPHCLPKKRNGGEWDDGMDDLGAGNLQMGRLYPRDSSINHHIFIIK